MDKAPHFDSLLSHTTNVCHQSVTRSNVQNQKIICYIFIQSLNLVGSDNRTKASSHHWVDSLSSIVVLYDKASVRV